MDGYKDGHAVAGGDFCAALSGQITHAHPQEVIGLLAAIPLIPGLVDLTAFKPDDYATDDWWSPRMWKLRAAGCSISA